MAVDIEGFDIVFSSANANHAREIDQSIARMSEKVPALSMGLSEMAKALDALGKINVDGVKKNLDAVKDSIENIDGSKLNKVFEIATSKSEGLLNSVTSLVNMLGKVDLSSFRGGAKTDVYDERSRVTTTRDTGGESQNQEQINALIRQREAEMQRLLDLQNALNQATSVQIANEQRISELNEKIAQTEQRTPKQQSLIDKRNDIDNQIKDLDVLINKCAEAKKAIESTNMWFDTYRGSKPRFDLAREMAREDVADKYTKKEEQEFKKLEEFFQKYQDIVDKVKNVESIPTLSDAIKNGDKEAIEFHKALAIVLAQDKEIWEIEKQIKKNRAEMSKFTRQANKSDKIGLSSDYLREEIAAIRATNEALNEALNKYKALVTARQKIQEESEKATSTKDPNSEASKAIAKINQSEEEYNHILQEEQPLLEKKNQLTLQQEGLQKQINESFSGVRNERERLFTTLSNKTSQTEALVQATKQA